jgi:hypothetical protein
MVSLASRSDISTYRRKSRLDEPALASSRLAPIEVPDFKSCSTILRAPGLDARSKQRRATLHAKACVHAPCCCTQNANGGGFDFPKKYVEARRTLRGMRNIASAKMFQNLHSAFCILHWRNHGLAGSISTAIVRHLPCLNRTTLSVARVAWPTTIAVQMWAGSRPYIAWNRVQSPSGMITCEMIEM